MTSSSVPSSRKLRYCPANDAAARSSAVAEERTATGEAASSPRAIARMVSSSSGGNLRLRNALSTRMVSAWIASAGGESVARSSAMNASRSPPAANAR